MKSPWLVCLWLASVLVSVAAPRPNIIIILTDYMGFSDIGGYGGEIATESRHAGEGWRGAGFVLSVAGVFADARAVAHLIPS